MLRACTHWKKLGAVSRCLLLLPVMFLLSGCSVPPDPVLVSLGSCDDSVFYSHGCFQDYTFYAKYYYTEPQLTENHYFEKLQDTDLDTLYAHWDDFEGWIETIRDSKPSDEVVIHYDFDRTLADTEDYFYLSSETHTFGDSHSVLVNYDIYFFDTQSLTLYFFHNNI